MRSWMFFLLSLAFLAGLQDAKLKSTSNRLLMVLVLGGVAILEAMALEDQVGLAADNLFGCYDQLLLKLLVVSQIFCVTA